MIQEILVQIGSGSWRGNSVHRIVGQICVETLEIGLRVPGWRKTT